MKKLYIIWAILVVVVALISISVVVFLYLQQAAEFTSGTMSPYEGINDMRAILALIPVALLGAVVFAVRRKY